MDECIYPAGEGKGMSRSKKRRQEKGRDPYDGLRPWSAITHGVGVVLGILGTVLLILRSVFMGQSPWAIVSFALYGASMIGLYTASTLYHCLRTGVSGRIALRKYDHASIYVLIAGTYTPICLVALRQMGGWGWAMFGAIWALAIAGVIMTLFWVNSPRWVTSGVYLFMGWLAIIALYPLWQAIGWGGLAWLLAGGVLYTVGGVLYAVKWPGRNNAWFGCHEIFHLFILAGSICHYLLMYRILAVL